jgi:glycosyltransferase involved in cell wall biosynthesis
MKILFLSTRSPYPLISGHSLRTYHILKGAAEKHNVTLITFVQLKEELEESNLGHLRKLCDSVTQFQVPSDVSRLELSSKLLCNLVSGLPFVAQKYDSRKFRNEIRRALRKDKIDLVHVDLLPLSCYLDEFPDIPKILVNHNVESLRLYRWFKNEKNLLRKFYLGTQYKKLRRYEVHSMAKYDACVVVSEQDKAILREMGVQSKIFVVPNGTDTEFFKPLGTRVDQNAVTWVGHMDVHTNRDAALYLYREIYPQLSKRLGSVKMVFVGTSPPKEILEASKRDGNVMITGFVEDIRPYLAKAAVFVVPIRIGSGTRLKILDAMAMGKAIVSTSVGCEGLNVSHGENILIADSPWDFADQVVRVLHDESLRRGLEQNARALALEYDWKRQCVLQEEAYRYVIP